MSSSTMLPKLDNKMSIEGFQLLEELGSGSFGKVYKAQSQKYGIVALKVMLKKRFSEHKGFVGQLVENERKALECLKSDHIIKLYQYFETIEYAVFILEYCDGGTLEDYWMKQDNVIPQFQALIYFKQLLKGMKALHKGKIIHRDLKMANILLHQGILKIADLGFCHLLKDQDGLAYDNLGSYGTMAPEILERKPYGLQADMFAVGVILYQMLFSKFPFNSANHIVFLKEVKCSNPPKFKSIKGPVDKNICDLLTNMLKYDPKQRLKWSDLFSNSIFMGQSSMSIIKDHTQYFADIDPHKSKLFYQKAEANEKQYEIQNPTNDEQMQDEIFKTNHKIQEIMNLSKKNNKSNIPQQVNPQLKDNMLQSQVLFQEANTFDQKAEDAIKQYSKAKQPISCLSLTYNKMKQFQHKQIFDCIFVSYILIKQIYFQHYKLRAQIKEDNFYPQLIKKSIFKTFMREFEEENEFLSIHLTIEYQTVQANFNKLEKYLKPNWICEVYQLSQTNQFQTIYREVLSNYLNIIGKEELQKQGEPDAQRLKYIAMVTNIKDYEELKTINNIDKGIAAIESRDINELIEHIKSSII